MILVRYRLWTNSGQERQLCNIWSVFLQEPKLPYISLLHIFLSNLSVFLFSVPTIDLSLFSCLCFNFKLLTKSNIPAKPHFPTGIFTYFWSLLVSYCVFFGRLLANIMYYSFLMLVFLNVVLNFHLWGLYDGQKCPVPLKIYAFFRSAVLSNQT